MNAIKLTTTLLLSLVAAALFGPLAAQSAVDTVHYPTLQGPRYTINIIDGYPAVTWDGLPAQDRLVVTGATIGYVLDDDGEAKLLLYWGPNFDDADREYVGEGYFGWALSQVKEGKYWDYRRRDKRGQLLKASESAPAAPTWTGERVVTLSNPGHELRIVVKREGATATDNGLPVEITGAAGNYRIIADDYEAGVSVRADGYVYHYYKPLR